MEQSKPKSVRSKKPSISNSPRKTHAVKLEASPTRNHGDSRLKAMIEITREFPTTRYSTNPPITDWSSDTSPLWEFINQQNVLGGQISEIMENEGDTESLQELLAQYLSNPFDIFGHSVSTPNIGFSLPTSEGSGDKRVFETIVARQYGAQIARIGVSGTSQVNQAMIIAARRARPGQDLILRTGKEHSSFLMGALGANVRIATLPTEIDARTGLQKLNIYGSLERALKDHGDEVLAVFLTLPTYEGAAINLKDIHQLCKANGCFLIIDGAWSGMWGFNDVFPPSLASHCDVMSVSLHKAGLAPCQVSAALFNDETLLAAYDEVSAMGLSTTSPNHLLLAVAEARFNGVVDTGSSEQWSKVVEVCNEVRSELTSFEPSLFHLEADQIDADYMAPNNLVLFTHEAHINARKVATILFEQFGRIVETASDHCLQLLFSPGNLASSDALIEDFASALISAKTQTFPMKSIAKAPTVCSPKVTRPAELFFFEYELVPLADAAGRTATSTATITPPCQCLWEPGTSLSQSMIDTATRALNGGQTINGVDSIDDIATARVVAHGRDYTVNTLITPLFDPQLIGEMGGFLTGGWAGPPYNHAFVHENDPSTSMSPSAYMTITSGECIAERSWYECEELEEIELHPGWHRVIDRDRYEQVLSQRLSDPGYLTLVRDGRGKLKGVFHCRSGTTVDRLIETEEWRFSNMMCTTLPPIQGSRQHILERLQFHFGISGKHKVNAISSQILHPSLRGGSALHDMIKDLALTMSAEHARLPLICELSDEPSPSRIVNEATLERVVYNVLPPENGHCIGYSSRMSNALFYYITEREHWTNAVKEQVRKSRSLFFPHPEDHPNLKVRETADGRGLGVFATGTGIETGDIVARFTGETYQSESACALHSIMVNHAIQTGPDTFLFAKHSVAQLINASHAPNLGLHDSTALVALRNIEPGEELTWSYEMSEDSDWRHSPCLCGAKACPGFIGSFSDLPKELQKHYIDAGIASDWIIQKYR